MSFVYVADFIAADSELDKKNLFRQN
jgi:hypothetical protein